MAHDSKPDSAAFEALDACRPVRFDPERRDWQQPETAALAEQIAAQPRLAELRERMDSLDSAIAATMAAGSVPEKLAERLMSALRSAAPAESAGPANDALEPVSSRENAAEATIPLAAALVGSRVGRAVRGSVFRRRWRAAGAVAMAVATAACLAAIWAFRTPQPLSYDQVIAEAKLFDASALANKWKSLTKDPPDKWYSISRAIAARPTDWQEVVRFLGRNGVAYQVSSGRGAKAVLYIVPLKGRQSLEVAGQSPPRLPDMTGGRATAAWTDGTRLWVLVVRGGQHEYRSFTHSGVM
ncbi:MAG TPA: hypothetical protein VMV10_12705 [Pirellulales bacterium]|nr:hypothetical protein [Pirellulales bacterium]